MSLVYDQNGMPYLIVQEQEKKSRMTGIEALKKHIAEAKSVVETLKTSFGPKGMDKIMMDPDGDLTITNDGATIIGMMEFKSQIAKLMSSLSKSQDDEIGDGTTGVIVIAGGLFEQVEVLLEKGIHPLKIADGFEKACDVAIDSMSLCADEIFFSKQKKEELNQIAKTSLNSKVIKKCRDLFAQIAVDSVLSVADLERKDVNFELIKIITKAGGDISETKLFHGVLLEKEFSHPQMPKDVSNVQIAILTCPFEPPKPKTKHKLNIKDVEEYQRLQEYEKKIFNEMISGLKKKNVNVAACQWGFDDEANHLLVANGLSAIRWIGGPEIEQLAVITGGKIIPRFEDVSEEKLGKVGRIQEVTFGGEKMLLVSECGQTEGVSILIRGGNKMIVEEAKRSLHDSMCVVRNTLKDSRIVYGGGSIEIACSIAVEKASEEVTGEEQYVMKGFARALEVVPIALANNSGLDPVKTLSAARAMQIKEDQSWFGIDCLMKGETNMKKQKVFDNMRVKQQQIILATQLVKMILKIDDVIEQQSEEKNYV